MAAAPLDDNLRRFIADHVDAIDTLEVLLLLARDPDRSWTVDQIAAELRTSGFAASQRVTHLAHVGLVSGEDGRHTFRPARPEQSSLVHELAEAYRERRTSVTSAIYSRPTTDNPALRSFADAFRIKKGKP